MEWEGPGPWGVPLRGALDQVVVESVALAPNRLRDPSRRPLLVYTPPGYAVEPERRYASLYVLQGMTGQVDMWRNRTALRPTMIERVDQLFSDPGVPPCLVVFVDCWTSLGGSQFLDSPATGQYHTYLCDEVVALVDSRYRTLAHPDHRGITGHSSGGYGAMVSSLLRPDLFGGVATHAGDACFELCYLPEFPHVVRALRTEHDGSYQRFFQDFRARPAFSRPTDGVLLNAWCMAACYSADLDGTVRLPFDLATGRLDEEVWGRWLAWDPVRLVARRAEAAAGLRAVYIDAGTRDEYFLDCGAQAYRDALRAVGQERVVFQLFEGGHGGSDHRYPLGLRHLAERLAP
ncbi:MAG TPA: alpha/beta hydrolase-fold protein [Verrucomicrobiae bacterium]|nr:alpha/beta hydrolase-fold protein [Verrucomicrobiae bacterium]